MKYCFYSVGNRKYIVVINLFNMLQVKQIIHYLYDTFLFIYLHIFNLFFSFFFFFFFSGDYAVKAVGVIPDPETFIFELEAVDRFMILGINSSVLFFALVFSIQYLYVLKN